MALHIDRVKMQLDVLGERAPEARDGAPAGGAPQASVGADALDRERLKQLVMDVLREHLQALRRRGAL